MDEVVTSTRCAGGIGGKRPRGEDWIYDAENEQDPFHEIMNQHTPLMVDAVDSDSGLGYCSDHVAAEKKRIYSTSQDIFSLFPFKQTKLVSLENEPFMAPFLLRATSRLLGEFFAMSHKKIELGGADVKELNREKDLLKQQVHELVNWYTSFLSLARDTTFTSEDNKVIGRVQNNSLDALGLSLLPHIITAGDLLDLLPACQTGQEMHLFGLKGETALHGNTEQAVFKKMLDFLGNLHHNIQTNGTVKIRPECPYSSVIEKQAVGMEIILKDPSGHHGLEVTNLNGSEMWVIINTLEKEQTEDMKAVTALVMELMSNHSFRASCAITKEFTGLFSIGGMGIEKMVNCWVSVINRLKHAKQLLHEWKLETAADLTRLIVTAFQTKVLSLCDCYHHILNGIPTHQYSVLVPFVSFLADANGELLSEMEKCLDGKCKRGRPTWKAAPAAFSSEVVTTVWAKTAADRSWHLTLQKFLPQLLTVLKNPFTLNEIFEQQASSVSLKVGQSVFIKEAPGSIVTLQASTYQTFTSSLVTARACSMSEHDIWLTHITRHKLRMREVTEALLLVLQKDLKELNHSEYAEVEEEEVSPSSQAGPRAPFNSPIPSNQLEDPELFRQYEQTEEGEK